MKIFIAFRFTGEDPVELDKALSAVKKTLENQGHEVSCTLWDGEMFQKEKFSFKQIMDHGLNFLNEADAVLVLLTSNEKSEGMLIEVGYAMAKGKKILVAKKEGVTARFTEALASSAIVFGDTQDLLEKLKV